MFIPNYQWEHVLLELDSVISTHSYVVIPSKMELRKNNMYAHDYAWMFAFEKMVIAQIEETLQKTIPYNDTKLLFSVGGAFSEAMSNAFLHGNKRDTNQKIEVEVAISNRGLGFSIKDQGSGFEFKDVIEQLLRGKVFFHVAGNGFKVLNNSDRFHACYVEGGSRLNLLFIF